jgi:TRAP-type mannitol/chloroaromatic compound transport system permease small subunit|tara:strand:- start:915 stop:1043 length:129 start_codon:yes stop_codon:yes gene_type:complete
MDEKLKENVIAGIKIVAMLFFLMIFIGTLVWPGVDKLTNLFQ